MLAEPSEINKSFKNDTCTQDIVKPVEENFRNPEFNVDQLIKMSYVSRTVFYNKIKGLISFSPNEFLRRMRLKMAANLLSTTDYNVSEVALYMGFNDVKYFSRRFKEVYHRLPSEYKNVEKAR